MLGEEKGLREDFRHGIIIGTRQFVDRIKARYASERQRGEVPQQRGLVGRINTEAVPEKVTVLLDCDV